MACFIGVSFVLVSYKISVSVAPFALPDTEPYAPQYVASLNDDKGVLWCLVFTSE